MMVDEVRLLLRTNPKEWVRREEEEMRPMLALMDARIEQYRQEARQRR